MRLLQRVRLLQRERLLNPIFDGKCTLGEVWPEGESAGRRDAPFSRRLASLVTSPKVTVAPVKKARTCARRVARFVMGCAASASVRHMIEIDSVSSRDLCRSRDLCKQERPLSAAETSASSRDLCLQKKQLIGWQRWQKELQFVSLGVQRQPAQDPICRQCRCVRARRRPPARDRCAAQSPESAGHTRKCLPQMLGRAAQGARGHSVACRPFLSGRLLRPASLTS